MHAGAEGSDAEHVAGADETYLGEPRGNSRAFAHAMIRAGADLVFGSGPHVLRGIEWYRSAADRLQPREPRRHAHAQHDRLARDERAAARDARRARQLPRRVGRTAAPRRRGTPVPDARRRRRAAHPRAFARRLRRTGDPHLRRRAPRGARSHSRLVDELLAVGERNRLRAAVDVELVEDALDVRADRRGADRKLLRDRPPGRDRAPAGAAPRSRASSAPRTRGGADELRLASRRVFAISLRSRAISSSASTGLTR